AYVLAHAAPYFPEGSIHVVVVDPGVGTDRSILVGQFGGQLFIFPDNGVITIIRKMLPLEGLVSVRDYKFLGDREVSPTFHGRDVFAPLAAAVSNGLRISDLGPTPPTYKLLDLPEPIWAGGTLVGKVVYVDRFGNLITSINERHIRERFLPHGEFQISCNGHKVSGLKTTYGQAGLGEPLALIDSMGDLELAVNLGRACDEFDARPGMTVEVAQLHFLEG
ncbi:MAG: SAM-dependent chlorinase/fluorinase, partial [Phycisphaerales bacterium]|nr:SAM-dependent chlorinase/fluorinase [Phycisphaerales bacterium]